MGWGWLSTIAPGNKVWVITNDICKPQIEAYVRDHADMANVHFTFLAWNTAGIGTIFWPLLRRLRYAGWRRRAADAALRICAEQPIDVCHYVNAVGFLDVVPLWKTGLPFIWGPVGGLTSVHKRLFAQLSIPGKLFYGMKNLFRRFAIRMAPAPRNAAKHASAVIAATAEVQDAMHRAWGIESTVISEIGIPESSIVPAWPQRESGEALKIVWSGRLYSGKAPKLAIDALARLPATVDWQLRLVGDGPDRQQIEDFARQKGVADRCVVTGWLPHAEALQELQGAHVFLFTSLYDLTSSVLVEALQNALPVVCLSSQSAAGIVADDCGLVVDVDHEDGLAPQIAAAISALYFDEARRGELAERARAKARSFTWQAKREALDSIYDAATGNVVAEAVVRDPCFIVGSPRSGTTLFASLLDRHSSICVPPETQFCFGVLPMGRVPGETPDHGRIADQVFDYWRIVDLNVSRQEFAARFGRVEASYANAFRCLLECYRENAGTGVVVEKSPLHLHYVDLLLEWFPDAQVFCIVRDGRDVAASITKAPFSHRNPRRHAAEWVYESQLTRQLIERYPDNLFALRFEDLLTEPANVVSNVCKRLGVDFEASQLQADQPSKVVPDWEREWKAQALTEVDPSQAQAWKRRTRGWFEREFSIQVMGDDLAHWNYEVPASDASAWQRFIVSIARIPYSRRLYRLSRRLLKSTKVLAYRLRLRSHW